MAVFDNDLLKFWLPETYHDNNTLALLRIVGDIYTDLHSKIDEIPTSIYPKSEFYDEPEDGVNTAQQNDFILWLSSWVNLLQGEEWSYQKKREILTRILPLYKKRGTIEGMSEYLRIYAGSDTAEVTIIDDHLPIIVGDKDNSILGVNMVIGGFPPELPSMEIAEESHVNIDTVISGFPPYYFFVNAAVSESGPTALSMTRRVLRKILDMEKPAHTWYRLWVKGPTFYLHDDIEEATAILGVNTII